MGPRPEVGAAMALPKMAVPGVGDLAYLLDTEANVPGILQPTTGG
jgi:hypothetical protein